MTTLEMSSTNHTPIPHPLHGFSKDVALLIRQGRSLSLKSSSVSLHSPHQDPGSPDISPMDQLARDVLSHPTDQREHLLQFAPLPHLTTPYEILMHALSQLTPHEAQWWSRGHVYTNTPISPAMWGLMKVAGKRLKYVSDHEIKSHINTIRNEHSSISASDLSPWLHLLQRFTCISNQGSDSPLEQSIRSCNIKPYLGQRVPTLKEAGEIVHHWMTHENTLLKLQGGGEEEVTGRRWGGKRRVVGALALDDSFTVIGYALNQPQLGATAHAEWCLLDQLWRAQRWPQSGQVTLISSLKPCKLCAGAWITHASYQRLEVYFLHNDPGPGGQNTALDDETFAYQEARRWCKSRGSWSQFELPISPDSPTRSC